MTIQRRKRRKRRNSLSSNLGDDLLALLMGTEMPVATQRSATLPKASKLFAHPISMSSHSLRQLSHSRCQPRPLLLGERRSYISRTSSSRTKTIWRNQVIRIQCRGEFRELG